MTDRMSLSEFHPAQSSSLYPYCGVLSLGIITRPCRTWTPISRSAQILSIATVITGWLTACHARPRATRCPELGGERVQERETERECRRERDKERERERVTQFANEEFTI